MQTATAKTADERVETSFIAGKCKKAKGGDLGDGAKQLRVRFGNPESEGAIIDYVVDTESGDGKSERLMKAKKAYDEAKKAYAAAKKADGKARKGKRAAQYLIQSGNETLGHIPGGNGEDVSLFLRGMDGTAKKSRKKADGLTFAWTADASIDVHQGKRKDMSKSKGKSKVDSITFRDAPKGVRHVGTEGQVGKGSFVFDTSTRSGKAKKGLVVIDTWSESKTVDKGDLDTALKLLIQGDGKDAHGVWVVGGEDSKADGAWVTETPSVAKEVLLKLLGGKDAKGNQAVLLKLLEGARVHRNDVQVIVESADGPAIDVNREEESGDGELREVIEEMRAEMRELRQMVQENRNSLRSNRASSNSATRVRTDRLLPPPIREKDAARVRVRRR